MYTSGIIHQARLPPAHVLLLPLQHDRRPDPGRIELTKGQDAQCYAARGILLEIPNLQYTGYHTRDRSASIASSSEGSLDMK
jgi:hypothetical protein